MMQFDATILYEDFIKTLHEWKSGPLKSFIQSLGFDENEVLQESDTHASLLRDDVLFTFYAENDKASLHIFNAKDLKYIDAAHFKWENGEWNEEEDKR